MRLYGYWRSSCTWRVRIALAFKGVAHQYVPVDLGPGRREQHSAAYRARNPLGQVPLLVALDGVTDPRNLGAIVRSVAAFGGQGVIVPQRRSVGMTASAWKTSAGAAARIPVAQAANLTRALEDFRKAGFFVIGLDMDGDVELPDLELASEPLVVVVGSEGKGLSRLVSETCDQIVSVPMSVAFKKADDIRLLFLGLFLSVFVVLTLLLNLGLGFVVIGPVMRLSRIAEDVSLGKADVPEYERKGSDQIAVLVASFNRMRRSLQEAMRMLSERR